MKLKRNQLLIIILVTGFLFGVLYVMKTKTYLYVFDESNLSFLKTYEIEQKEYLFYLLRERIGQLLLVTFLGYVKYTEIYGGILTLLGGICGGAVFAAAGIQMKLKGIVLCAVGLFPQILFYGLVFVILIDFWMGRKRWTWTKSLGVIIFMILGIASEAYINPFLLKIFW